MSFQPKDPSQDGHKKDQNSNQNRSQGLQPRQMSRRMGRSMNRFGSGEFSNTNLDSTVQAKMENAFQEDFSDVQVTKDSSEATQMGAQAFAQGNKIHFAPGNYKPHTTKGQELIGHELAHVVQQKQGRVKATTQAKGAPVNDDPALENEADLMGKKAADGEQALEQSNGLNSQESEKFPEPEPDHPFMKVIGWGTAKSWTIWGTQYSTRFIYSGKASDWKKLLATLDSDSAVIKYLVPFFAASGCGGGNVKYNFYQSKYTEDYQYKDVKPSQEDILELLKALYDTDSSTKSSIDLPNEFWMEGEAIFLNITILVSMVLLNLFQNIKLC